MKEYALYKGEELLGIGTPYQLAEQLNVKIETIKYYGTEAYKKKLSKRKKSNNPRELVVLK